MDSIPYLTALLPVSDEVRMRCHLHSLTIRALSMADSTETLTLSGQEAAFSDDACVTLVDATSASVSVSASTTTHLKAPDPYARMETSATFGGPSPHGALSSLSVAAAAARMKLMTKQKSWTGQAGFDTDQLPVTSRRVLFVIWRGGE